MPLLDGEVTDVAVATADLNGFLRDLDRDLAGLKLRHRTLGLFEFATVAAFPQRAPDQAASGFDLHCHVGELERDCLVFDDRVPELPSLFSVLKCELERRPRNTESLGTDDRASRLERLQCHRRPRPFTRASTSQLGLQ